MKTIELGSLPFTSIVLVSLAACSTPALSPQGARVAIGRTPPPAGCTVADYLVGEGGGTFGGGYLPNDQLITYAVNDLRNKAANLGADYVQTDPPQLGSGKGTTTTATITGTAYRCRVAAADR